MALALELTLRLLVAGLIGALIGYERELRAKGAGIRTHVLVALGAALFMIISQYGFSEAPRFDAARVAAGVVGGLGFLGGGIIMKTGSNHVSGLTTAAGIWVTGAIGLSIGCGLFELGILCAFLVIVCLEALNYYSIRMGQKEVAVVLSSEEQEALVSAVRGMGRQVKAFSLSRKETRYQAQVILHISKKEYSTTLLDRLSSLPGVRLESLD